MQHHWHNLLFEEDQRLAVYSALLFVVSQQVELFSFYWSERRTARPPVIDSLGEATIGESAAVLDFLRMGLGDSRCLFVIVIA